MNAEFTPSKNKQFYSVDELRNLGLSYYRINKLVEDGTFKRINRKTYENSLYSGDISDFKTASIYVPKGVVCLLSAARYYNLTTFLPDSVDMAIERSMKVSTLPEWPNISLWYFSDKRYLSGMNNIQEQGSQLRVFDVEKTVIDILHYRNKIGMDETSQILKNYLYHTRPDIDKLYRYSHELGTEKILSTYLEVLL